MIVGIDPIVVTVEDLDRTIAFYTGLHGMGCPREPAEPWWAGQDFEPATRPL